MEPIRFQGDIDGFVDGSRRMAQGGTGAIHTICPVEVHLNGEKAVSESTGSISIRFEHEGHEFDCVSITRFVSRLQKVTGEWKLLTLEAIYERDYIMSIMPSPSARLDVPSLSAGRQSYKCIAWLLSKKGFAVAQDLPGTDRPTSSEEFLTKTFA